MDKLPGGDRDKFNKFIAETNSSEKVAFHVLKACDWNLDRAFHMFFGPHFKLLRHIRELYNRYKDPHIDMIMVDGVSLLCRYLQVDPQDIVMLVLSWHNVFKAATMCEFSRQEFYTGMHSLGVYSLEKFCEKIPSMRAELKDEQKFCEIYNFAFGWAREKEVSYISQL